MLCEIPIIDLELFCFVQCDLIIHSFQCLHSHRWNVTIIFEDDVRFVRDIAEKVRAAMDILESFESGWDLLYLGRIRNQADMILSHVDLIVHPGYSYGTYAYAVSNKGVTKLLDAEPLANMIPLDEFLSVMYRQHPSIPAMAYGTENVLSAYAVQPSIALPIRAYSDTKTGNVVPRHT